MSTHRTVLSLVGGVLYAGLHDSKVMGTQEREPGRPPAPFLWSRIDQRFVYDGQNIRLWKACWWGFKVSYKHRRINRGSRTDTGFGWWVKTQEYSYSESVLLCNGKRYWFGHTEEVPVHSFAENPRRCILPLPEQPMWNAPVPTSLFDGTAGSYGPCVYVIGMFGDYPHDVNPEWTPWKDQGSADHASFYVPGGTNIESASAWSKIVGPFDLKEDLIEALEGEDDPVCADLLPDYSLETNLYEDY